MTCLQSADRPKIAAEALYRQGLAYQKQAQRAEYDQHTAGQAIATFTDFMTLYPNEPRVKEAQKTISSLRGEQARGSFEIARFYEKRRKWIAAETYYNEVVNLSLEDPNSVYATQAKDRINELKKRNQVRPAPAIVPPAAGSPTPTPAAQP